MHGAEATPHTRRKSAGRGARPVLVLGGAQSALAVNRALGRHGVPVVSLYHSQREYASASKYVSRRILTPDPVLEADRFVRVLTSLGKEYAGSLLVPAYDDALLTVAQHHEALSEHFEVGCMEWERTGKCLDKKQTYAIADREGVPAPRTSSPTSLEELEAWSDAIAFPCLVKPRLSHLYSRARGGKMEKVATRAELVRSWTQAREAGVEVMVQEFIPGPDHNGANYNVYMVDGEVWAECTAHKLRSKRPEIESPRLVLSRDIPEVAELGRRITKAVGVHGFVNVEFKRHARTGVFHLIEINARHNMSAALAVRCGMNFPLIEYDHRMNGARPGPLTAETGVYWINLEWDVREAKRLGARREIPRNYLRPYVQSHVFDVLDWRDPAPFAKQAKDLIEARTDR